MGHYWGYHWCSLEKGIFKVGQSELPEVFLNKFLKIINLG